MEMTKEKRDTIITSLYDRYGKGEISATQREQLIQKVNDTFYTEMVSITTEKAKSEQEEDKAKKAKDSKDCDKPSKEKFELFKKTVDERCEKGEITEEFRDQLLEKAKEKFCPDKSE